MMLLELDRVNQIKITEALTGMTKIHLSYLVELLVYCRNPSHNSAYERSNNPLPNPTLSHNGIHQRSHKNSRPSVDDAKPKIQSQNPGQTGRTRQLKPSAIDNETPIKTSMNSKV